MLLTVRQPLALREKHTHLLFQWRGQNEVES